ncbi:MAG: hypothetical protein KUG77_25140 [Nannocystaceae bacterium]|nr:hypothetical protein [Nannocystaceae bacterium]
MTYRFTELPLTAFLALICSASVGCDAPKKTVGQETESDGESSSDSDAPNCGAIVPCGSESDSDSDSMTSTGSSSTTSAGSESSGEEGSTSGAEGSTGGEESSTGGGASLPDGFEETLSHAGCADMTVWGKNDDDSIALVLFIDDNLVADAAAAGTTYEGTHAVAEFGTFSVLVGSDVSALVCNDVDPRTTNIEQEWVATAGSVEITIEPEEDAQEFDTQGYATLQLSGIEVSFDGTLETLEDITFTNIAVGWLPG